MKILVCILLASIPAFIWGYIFYQKDKVERQKALATFLFGILSVTPILIYKWSWAHIPAINIFTYTNNFSADVFGFTPLLYLSVGSIFAFLFVGVIEEYMKHIVVKKADQGFFRNIDDAIEFSIMAALGFAFIENILYFYFIWELQGAQVLMISFVFRMLFSTFAHVLFSGIYGYYYGIAYFASPIWAEKERKSRHVVVQFFHRILHINSEKVFAVEKVNEGLFLAVILHALFNIFLEMGLTVAMIPFLVFGYSYLDNLFKEKENLKAYGHLYGEEKIKKTNLKIA